MSANPYEAPASDTNEGGEVRETSAGQLVHQTVSLLLRRPALTGAVLAANVAAALVLQAGFGGPKELVPELLYRWLMVIAVYATSTSVLLSVADGVEVRRALREALPRLVAVAGAGGVFLVEIGFGLALFVVPGLWLFVRHVFAPLLVLDRGVRFLTSFDTSDRLTRGQWWVTGGRLLVGLAPFLAFTGFVYAMVTRGPGVAQLKPLIAALGALGFVWGLAYVVVFYRSLVPPRIGAPSES